MLAQDFIAPVGELRREMFAGEDLAARLDKYLADALDALPGVSAEKLEAATRAYVYGRAYRALYVLLTTQPTRTSFGQDGSVEYSARQLAAIQSLAIAYESEVTGYLDPQALIPPAVVTAIPTVIRP